MERLIEVAFNLPIRRSFTYSVPEELDAPIGYRVQAPFGSRRLTGCVVGRVDEPPPGVPEIKPIARIVDKRPVFDSGLLELADWIADM